MPSQILPDPKSASQSKPELVSIGIPCFNRARGLDTALKCLTVQSHRNLEIILSDNASTDPQVKTVIEKWKSQDPRIRAFRQPTNIGPIDNFRFVLEKAEGDFFMWAADDDEYKRDLVASALRILVKEKKYAAVSMEAQYRTESGLMPFVPEGEPFYEISSTCAVERVRHMLKYNYGNLFYGLYRRSLIIKAAQHFATNEIPFFVGVAEAGNWKVVPRVKVVKKTSLGVYQQVVWENQGGRLPNAKYSWKYLSQLIKMWNYHRIAGRQIQKALAMSEFNYQEKKHLIKYSWKLLVSHFLSFVILWKKPKWQK